MSQGSEASTKASMQAGAAVAGANEQTGGAASIAIAMFCVLLLAYMLMAADRYLIPVLATALRRERGFSPAEAGLLTTIFTLGLGIGGLPTGYLLARFSRKTVLLFGIAIFSATTALTVTLAGFWALLLCLAVQGVGMAMLATSMFALAANYFSGSRAAAIGACNFCYGLGGWFGPRLATRLLASYGTWHAPMIAYGGFGFVLIAVILATVRPWFSETRHASKTLVDTGGASSLLNRNTVILTVLSIIHGLSMYGFLGQYPTFLQEHLHYAATDSGKVISFFGLGALASIVGGWLGDKLSPKLVLSASLLSVAVLGYLFFQDSFSMLTREIMTCIYGVTGSAVLYVNLAGYHVKSLRRSLSSKGSGMFVTSLYGAGAISGGLIAAIEGRAGWFVAGQIQMSLICVIGAVLALALNPKEMSV
jgi:MFS transporter, DHA1 family, inner membrane transport protein